MLQRERSSEYLAVVRRYYPLERQPPFRRDLEHMHRIAVNLQRIRAYTHAHHCVQHESPPWTVTVTGVYFWLDGV